MSIELLEGDSLQKKTKEKVEEKVFDMYIDKNEERIVNFLNIKEDKKNKFKIKDMFISFISLVGLLYLSFLTYLEVFHISIEFCNDACSYSVNYISISNVTMYLMGIVFFLIILLNVLNSKDRNLLFYSGFIFELIQFGNLYIIHDTFCIKCFVVIVLISIIGLILNVNKTVFIFLAIYLSFAIQSVEVNNFRNFSNNNYILIEKDNCSFCEEAKKEFKKSNINYLSVNAKKASELIDIYNIKKFPFLIKNQENLTLRYEGLTAIKNLLKESKNKEGNLYNNTLNNNTSLDVYFDKIDNNNGSSSLILEKDGCLENNKDETCN